MIISRIFATNAARETEQLVFTLLSVISRTLLGVHPQHGNFSAQVTNSSHISQISTNIYTRKLPSSQIFQPMLLEKLSNLYSYWSVRLVKHC